jgi:hypothetical protein
MDENDIFRNQKDIVQNIRGSAENLGVNPDIVAPPQPKMEKKAVMLAKKNCKTCWGQGVLTITGHDVAVRTKELNTGELKPKGPGSDEGTVFLASQRGKFLKTEGRNSSRREPEEKKLGLMYCKCVRQKIVEVPVQATS